ncbi:MULTISPECIES: DUF7139 domain-containing protein [Salinibaculum]|uniref:DUF7139 domain-containing protein n=1 Tax=Salinibaculum TaxID=2732368 RepID=UPI0030CC6763
MPSLDEAYDRRTFTERNPRRVAGGLAVGAAGAIAVLAAILLVAVGGDAVAAKAQAGVLAGLGIPALLLSVVFVLPASTRKRVGVVAGSALTVVGVWLFWHAYPGRWTRTADSMAFETVMLYAVGAAVALWFVFSALATFRLRNNPAGTVELEVVRHGETKTVEVSRDRYRDIVSDGGDVSQVIEELEK